MNNRLRRAVVTLLQWTVALAALAYVLSQVDWQTALAKLAAIELVFVAAVLLITCFELGSRFFMWYVLIEDRESASIGTIVRIDLVIKFINHVIPSKVSGHSIAPLVIRHYTDNDWSESVSIAGVNLGLYAVCYGLGALVGLVVFAGSLGGGLLVVILLSTALYLGGGAVVLLAGRRMDISESLFTALGRWLGKVPKVGDRLAGIVGKGPSFTEESAAVFRVLSGRASVVISYGVGWVFTRMVFPGTRVLILFVALGEWFTPAWLLPVALVTAYSVTVLPLTPGGVGVAEASATLVLVALGVPEEIAVTVVVLDRLFGVYMPAIVGVVPTLSLDLEELAVRRTNHQ